MTRLFSLKGPFITASTCPRFKHTSIPSSSDVLLTLAAASAWSESPCSSLDSTTSDSHPCSPEIPRDSPHEQGKGREACGKEGKGGERKGKERKGKERYSNGWEDLADE